MPKDPKHCASLENKLSMMNKTKFILLCVSMSVVASSDLPCNKRFYNHNANDSFVCVCNSTYCDTIQVDPSNTTNVHVYTSSSASKRFQKSYLCLNKNTKRSSDLVILISTNKKYQNINGFGGAITDACLYNLLKLSPNSQDNLLASYFSRKGIEYNIGRIPIASCDYSLREYTYLDTPNDFNLTTFSLAKEDIEWRIPTLKKIINISPKNLMLFGSPWTAPAWMKTNHGERGWGWLIGEPGDKYHKTWANYFVRYFDEYKKHGINFWGLTMQNEPTNGLFVKSKWQSTGWTPQTERDFIKLDLGPALENGGYSQLKLMILDDQRMFLPAWANIVLRDPDAAKYVAGIGVHWYWNWLAGPELLTKTHEANPNVFILATEACNKAYLNNSNNWGFGEKYSQDILDNLNNWGSGWVDWNMCLDLKGGPNWAGNYDESPIIVNATADEFYKLPMYYHLGHFSKFILEKSLRISSKSNIDTELRFVAVLRPDGDVVFVILNKSTNDHSFDVNVDGNSYFSSIIPKRSIQTYTWKL